MSQRQAKLSHGLTIGRCPICFWSAKLVGMELQGRWILDFSVTAKVYFTTNVITLTACYDVGCKILKHLSPVTRPRCPWHRFVLGQPFLKSFSSLSREEAPTTPINPLEVQNSPCNTEPVTNRMCIIPRRCSSCLHALGPTPIPSPACPFTAKNGRGQNGLQSFRNKNGL